MATPVNSFDNVEGTISYASSLASIFSHLPSTSPSRTEFEPARLHQIQKHNRPSRIAIFLDQL